MLNESSGSSLERAADSAIFVSSSGFPRMLPLISTMITISFLNTYQIELGEKIYNKRNKYKNMPSDYKVLDQPSYSADFQEKDIDQTSPFDQYQAQTEIARVHHRIFDLKRPEKCTCAGIIRFCRIYLSE